MGWRFRGRRCTRDVRRPCPHTHPRRRSSAAPVSPSRRAGTNGDQAPRHCADLPNPLGIGLGGDRSLHERHVVGSRRRRAGHLGEVRDAHGAGEHQQLLLAIEQAQLAAVTGGELPDCQRRTPIVARCPVCSISTSGHRKNPSGRCPTHRSRSVNRWATAPAYGRIGPSRHSSNGPNWQ